MNHQNWGIVGIGKLGSALIKELKLAGITIGIYHSNPDKAHAFHLAYPNTKILRQADLANLNFLILALPAHQITKFIDQQEAAGIALQKLLLINMATTVNTVDLRQKYPQLTLMGVKYMGHAEYLREQGDGLFVAEENSPHGELFDEVDHFFSKIGQVITDNESTIAEVNKLATYYAIKAAKEVEHKMSQKGFSELYQKRVLTAILPTVIKSYIKGELGHFAQKIADELEEELKQK